MGGKTAQSTQQVTVPPAVLAQYQAVNARATQTAGTPFQTYGGEFVSPVNQQQQAGISGVNTAATQAQPYFDAATGQIQNAQAGTAPLNAASATGLGAAQAGTQPYNAAAAGMLGQAADATQPINAASLGTLGAAQAGTQPYNSAAAGMIGGAAGATQPTNAAALGLTAASAGQVNADPITGQQINQYMNPYLQTVLGSTARLINQNNQQQQAGQLGTAIQSGAFGGDRAGLAAANLEQQQNLAAGQIYSGIASNAFDTALSTAQQQQGVNLGAGQANRAALANAGAQLAGIGQTQFGEGVAGGQALAGLGQTQYGEGANTAAQLAALGQTQFGEGVTGATTAAGLGQTAYGEGANTASQLAALGQTQYGEGANTATTLAGLGTGAQAAGLQGAEAQVGAGTLQQQTQQAQDTALYNQFLQQQSYPFQVDQFLANIAEGTGALSGSTTTTQQPGGFFSDRRLKHNIRKIGKTFDGQPIYSYSMHGDPRTQIGLIAQDVEKKHPESVGVAGHYKVVDYGKATEDAANRGHFYSGGLVPLRRPYQGGGGPVLSYADSPSSVSAMDLSNILQAQREMYAPYSGGTGLYGNTAAGPYGGKGHVPPANGATPHLVVASGSPQPAQSGSSKVQQTIGLGKDAYQGYKHFNKPTTNAGVSGDAAPEGPPTYLSPDAQAAQAADAAAAGPPETAGLGAADTSAASVAAPAAADVAAPAAADAAAGTAAGAAGAGAAGAAIDTGAAEAAAALAAEYAAADIGAAAIIAAKRGGKMFAAGGMPYEGSVAPEYGANGSMDIPDVNSGEKLQTAGPLKKQPTGFQTLLTMGNPNNAGTMTGDMFSNTAVKRGGRIGYADGGAPDVDDTDTTDDTPPPAPDPTTTKIPGVAASGAAKDTDHWYKHSANVVPLLQGLAAMGTAPTQHLGVALAAGLGAGASQWLPAHAQEQDIQSQTIANQKAQWQLNQLRSMDDLQGPGDGGSSQPGTSTLPSVVDPASIRTAAQRQYAVRDIWTPQETQQLQQAKKYQLGGLGNITPQITAQHQARLDNLRTKNQLAAGNAYDQVYPIAFAGQGQAFTQLQNVSPGAAAEIAKRTSDPIAQDKLARSWATETGNSVMQYSGRSTKAGTDGVERDQMGRPVLGSVPQGMSAAEHAANLRALAGTVDTGAEHHPQLGSTNPSLVRSPTSPYEVPGTVGPGMAASPGQPATGLAAQPPAPAPVATSPAAATPTPARPVPPRRPAEQQALLDRLHGKPAPWSVPSNAPSSATATAPAADDFKDAPRKPSWADNPDAVAPTGQGVKYTEKKTALMDEANDIKTTQFQKVNVQRMQNELPNAKVGPGTRYLADLQTTLGNLTGSQFIAMLNSNPSAYDLLSKGLGNQALQQQLANIREQGGSVRLGAQESGLILNKLSASPEMARGAIKTLLDWQSQQLDYEAGRQNAIPGYLAANGDARLFDNYYSNKHPLGGSVSTAAPAGTGVQTTRTATGRHGEKYHLINNQWVRQVKQ